MGRIALSVLGALLTLGLTFAFGWISGIDRRVGDVERHTARMDAVDENQSQRQERMEDALDRITVRLNAILERLPARGMSGDQPDRRGLSSADAQLPDALREGG